MKDGCLGCAFVSESPVRLLTGRIVCQTCPRATEERTARDRHVGNLQRIGTREQRREYMDKLQAAEGVASAEAVRTAFAIWFDAARGQK